MDKTKTYIIFIPSEDTPMAQARIIDLWFLFWENNCWRSHDLTPNKEPDPLPFSWVENNVHRIFPNVSHLRVLHCAQCDAPSFRDYLCKECRDG